MGALSVVRTILSEEKIFKTRLGNALGLQIGRILLARGHLLWRRRRCPEKNISEVRQLAREGYCVIEDFLPADQFDAVRQEFGQAQINKEFDDGKIDRENIVTDLVHLDWHDPAQLSAAVSALRTNEKFNSIIRGHEGRTTNDINSLGSFKCMLWASYRRDDSNNRPRIETSNCELHADTYHTITKAFLYLNDVDRTNGSHVYVPRSHRMSLGRLLLDYINSIRTMYGAPRTAKEEVARFGMEPVSLQYPANTLIIANEQGFHAQGGFEPDRVRNVVYFEYRSHPFRYR